MYTSNERVIRNGHLIAFEGEVMPDEEAARRGLSSELPAGEEPAGEKPAAEKPKRSRRRRAQDAVEEEE
ncbi:hypothetical protein [Olsenella sp. HMSC062G07]|uniref:hypothetical protein n=1 Tax=Olsenella sp. HMSC062G07 TaxID=1739330 RepID=UPI0008A54B5C|nr:hypothetical protein [Olsenella sp. HMSC062G07]OFK22927.1 hypothetical protein HMPREF2826_00700 [Olsenella sp. HMSC062G07]